MQVYHHKKFLNDTAKFWVKNFLVNFTQILSLTIWDIYASGSEDDSSSKYSSDDVTIRPTKIQKSLVTESDTESENETHGAGEAFTGVSGVNYWT